MSSRYEVYQATIEDLDELSIVFDQYRIFYGQPSDVEQAHEFLFQKFEHLILNDLYVLEEYRRQGLGQSLLNTIRKYAIQIKAKGIELSTEVSNPTAQHLYEQNGYVKDQNYHHYFLGLS